MPSLAVLAELSGLWIFAGLAFWAWFVVLGLKCEERDDESAEAQGAAWAWDRSSPVMPARSAAYRGSSVSSSGHAPGSPGMDAPAR